MQLKRLVHLTIVTTALFFNAKISLAESLKVPYVSISGFQAPLWLGKKRVPSGKTNSMFNSSRCLEVR